MLFRRRDPLNWFQRLRHAVWPRSGWRRTGKYVWRRLLRVQDSPHAVALGAAVGIGISFTPFLGFHLVGAAVLAWALRANVLAAWIGTLFGNPWTFPFLWWASYQIGHVGVLLASGHPPAHFSIHAALADPVSAVAPVIWPLSIGSVLLGTLAGFATYWPVLRLIRRYRLRRSERLQQARMKRGERLQVMLRELGPHHQSKGKSDAA